MSNVTLDQHAFDAAATSALPVGAVNLLTGNYQVSGADVSVPGNQGDTLTVGRTFNTALAGTAGTSGAPTSGVFGPGWTSSLSVAGAGADWAALSDTGSVLTATGSDQATTSFASTGSGTYAPTGQDADSGLQVAQDTTRTGCSPTSEFYRCYDLTDLNGNTTVFRSVLGGTSSTLPSANGSPSAPVLYQMFQVIQPGSAGTTSYSYTSGLLSQMLAPVPAGATCTKVTSAATWTPGCRGLGFTYNASNELTAVTYQTSDGTNPLQVDVACYAYDPTSHQLTDEWDPRDVATAGSGAHPISCNPAAPVRPLHYSYDGSGRISSITPAYQSGTTPLVGWTIGYDTAGRISTVTRTHTDASGAETTRVLYGVPVAPDGTNPSWRPDLTAGTTGAWAQADNPDPNAGATAVCPPGSSATSSTTDVSSCALTYLDANGRAVNTAQYAGSGAAGWHLSTTEYDAGGHVVRTLSASNREEALTPTTGAGAALKLPSDTKAAALELSTLTQYTPNTHDGQPDLTSSFGPYHLVELPDGSTVNARAYSSTIYDNSTGDPFTVSGNEPGHPTGAGGALISYHLPVRATTSASLSPDTVATSLSDTRTSDTKYFNGTDYTGWTYRTPMQTIADPTGLAITRTTVYDAATGRVTFSRMPSAAGDTGNSSAGTTHTIYYTTGANPDDPACANTPLWDGLVCKTLAANLSPSSGLPSLITTYAKSYDYLARSSETDETSTTDSAHTRVSTSVFGFNSTLSGSAPSVTSANPYATTVEQSALIGGLGTAVPARTVTYDANTGLPTSTSNGTVADSTGYDNFGRVTSYSENTSATGAAGNTVTSSYDPTHGWVSQTTDAHTTVSYAYNQNGETRGLPTTKSISVAGVSIGSFTASYNPEGAVSSQSDPYGVVMSLSRDETGQLTTLTDTKGGNPWLSTAAGAPTDLLVPSIFGQAREHDGYNGAHSYSYDAVGRLSRASDTPTTLGATCSTRTYAFDADSNRTSSTSYPADSTGACQSATGASSTTHSYDTADRMLSSGGDTGLGYDTFGRLTTVPAADVTGGANVSVSYYANDMVQSQSQGSTTQSWTLDANGRLGGWTVTGSISKTNHYDNAGSDSPAWIAETVDSTQWTVSITDLLGSLAATVNQAGIATYQYTDLHGDVVATASSGVNSGNPTATADYGEYGTNPASTTRYGWLGAKTRSSDDLGGLVLMGVRLYNPNVGRFLQTDPIPGGSCNNYDYSCQDPINAFDLDGRMCWLCLSPVPIVDDYNLTFDLGKSSWSAHDVFEIMNLCFNCFFPIPGAPSSIHVGQNIDLHPYHMYFPVRVASISSSGWKFATRPGHPDYPGFISFSLTKSKNGHIKLHIHGVCPACGTFVYYQIAHYTWSPLADRLRSLVGWMG